MGADAGRALAERRASALDWDALAEEIEDLGREKSREIRNRLKVLLLHLLKWAYQPDARKGGWQATIREQRQQISDVIADSPSLHREPEDRLDWAYDRARSLASDETGMPLETFPRICPFKLEDVLREDWLP